MMNKNYAVAMNDNELTMVSGGGKDDDLNLGLYLLRGMGCIFTLGISELIISKVTD